MSSNIDTLLDTAMKELETNYLRDRNPNEFRRDSVFLFERLEEALYHYYDYWRVKYPELPQLELEDFAKELIRRSEVFNTNLNLNHVFEVGKQAKRVSPVCGCIIFNHDESKFVLCHNKATNTWMFPAGKHNIGEKFHETAIRETYEECGFDASGLINENDIPLQTKVGTKMIYLFVIKNISEKINLVPPSRDEVDLACFVSVNQLPERTFRVLEFLSILDKWRSRQRREQVVNNGFEGSASKRFCGQALSIYESLESPADQKAVADLFPRDFPVFANLPIKDKRELPAFEKKLLSNAFLCDDGLLFHEALFVSEKRKQHIKTKQIEELRSDLNEGELGILNKIFMALDRNTNDSILDVNDFSDAIHKINVSKQEKFRKIRKEMDIKSAGVIQKDEFIMYFLKQAIESRPDDRNIYLDPPTDNLLDLFNICRSSINDKLKSHIDAFIKDLDLQGVITPVEFNSGNLGLSERIVGKSINLYDNNIETIAAMKDGKDVDFSINKISDKHLFLTKESKLIDSDDHAEIEGADSSIKAKSKSIKKQLPKFNCGICDKKFNSKEERNSHCKNEKHFMKKEDFLKQSIKSTSDVEGN